MFAAYVSRHGHAFIDRALYLPKTWTADPARMAAAHVPDGTTFATKPALAVEMIERAIAAGVPFWGAVGAWTNFGIFVVVPLIMHWEFNRMGRQWRRERSAEGD